MSTKPREQPDGSTCMPSSLSSFFVGDCECEEKKSWAQKTESSFLRGFIFDIVTLSPGIQSTSKTESVCNLTSNFMTIYKSSFRKGSWKQTVVPVHLETASLSPKLVPAPAPPATTPPPPTRWTRCLSGKKPRTHQLPSPPIKPCDHDDGAEWLCPETIK